jgi:hypothetical protein
VAALRHGGDGLVQAELADELLHLRLQVEAVPEVRSAFTRAAMSERVWR